MTTLNVATPRKIAATASADAALSKGRHTPVDATAAARTMTLPTGASEGVTISVEKLDSSTNAVTVTGNIRSNAGASVALLWQYESVTFVADSAGSWWPTAGHKTKASLDAAFAPRPTQIEAAGPSSAVGTIVRREPCDTTTGWTATAATLSADTTHYQTGAQGLQIAGTSGVKTHKASHTGLGLNLTSAKQMFFRVYIAAAQAPNINVAYIGLVDNGGLVREYNIWLLLQQQNATIVDGWYSGAISLEEPSFANDPNYSFNFANVAQVYLGFDQVAAGYAAATMTFDDVYFYSPANTLPAIWLFADGTYSGAYDVGTAAQKAGAKIHFATNDNYVDVAGKMTSAQVADLVTAGHNVGIYGNNTLNPLWAGQSAAQKAALVASGQSRARSFPAPLPRFLSISGVAGWTPDDDRALLRRYFAAVTGGSDHAGKQVVRGVADLTHLWISDFVTTSALLTPTITAAVSGNLWTLGSAQNWTRIHPVKLSTTGTLPTTSPQVAAGTVYWLRIASTTTGTLHPTATDAINNTNVITVSATGSGTHTATAYNSATFGLRIAALILSKGLHVEGLHGSSAGEVTVARFVLDALASLVSNGEAKFRTISDMVAGTL